MNDDGLAVEHLTVSFGGLVAVEGLSLEAPVGRITGLIGPNGAGKTTTFNACTGLIRPRRGRIRLVGRDVTDLGPAARAQLGLGRTFQRMELFDSLTVEDNVSLGREAAQAGSNVVRHLVATRADRRLAATATDEAIDICGLGPVRDRVAGSLSTGQRRLVELARVLAGPFRMLLLDEPSSGLDANETHRFGGILRTVMDERLLGILLVEHDMTLVTAVCDVLFVLDFGRLIFSGSVEDTLASEEVRSAYLGTGGVEVPA